jgi:hypothetical protein
MGSSLVQCRWNTYRPYINELDFGIANGLLGQCKNLYQSHGKKMDEDRNQTLSKFGPF